MLIFRDLSLEHPEQPDQAASDASASGVRAKIVPSGAQVARALRQQGFDVRVTGPEHAAVMRGDSALLLIPLKEALHPATVRVLLNTLGVAPKELAAFLAEPDVPKDE
jgi:hypothetical protein